LETKRKEEEWEGGLGFVVFKHKSKTETERLESQLSSYLWMQMQTENVYTEVKPNAKKSPSTGFIRHSLPATKQVEAITSCRMPYFTTNNLQVRTAEKTRRDR